MDMPTCTMPQPRMITDSLDRRKDKVREVVDYGERIAVCKGGGAEYGDGERQNAPKADKEFCAFIGFHSIPPFLITDAAYRTCSKGCGHRELRRHPR